MAIVLIPWALYWTFTREWRDQPTHALLAKDQNSGYSFKKPPSSHDNWWSGSTPTAIVTVRSKNQVPCMLENYIFGDATRENDPWSHLMTLEIGCRSGDSRGRLVYVTPSTRELWERVFGLGASILSVMGKSGIVCVLDLGQARSWQHSCKPRKRR